MTTLCHHEAEPKPPKRHRWLGLLATTCLLAPAGLGQAQQVDDGEPSFLTVYGGAFDVFSSIHRGAELGVNYRPSLNWWHIHPLVGMNASTVGNVYFHAGISFDVFIGNRFVLTPNFSPGIFLRNGGKDLGHVIEFRTGIEAAYRFDDRSRIGIEIAHRSNAGLGHDNHCPCNSGEESLVISYHLPRGR